MTRRGEGEEGREGIRRGEGRGGREGGVEGRKESSKEHERLLGKDWLQRLRRQRGESDLIKHI